MMKISDCRLVFLPEVSPIEQYRGFRVKAFRQGACNLVERKLYRPVVRFVPFRGVVGVFLPRGAWAVEETLLEATWTAQGKPLVHFPAAQEMVYFGRILTVQELSFAGYEDVWLEADEQTLMLAYRRTVDVKRRQAMLRTFQHAHLLKRAYIDLDHFLPLLDRPPQAIVIHPLRPRILGQCTREGEIRLNLSLLQWPPEILTETLAHELAHLTVFNHSPAFWRRLTSLLPDWLPRSLAHYL